MMSYIIYVQKDSANRWTDTVLPIINITSSRLMNDSTTVDGPSLVIFSEALSYKLFSKIFVLRLNKGGYDYWWGLEGWDL